MSVRRIAAIDIGTVTTRLLVAEVSPGHVRQLDRRTIITHLGEGWTQTGRLSEAGIARVETAVAEFVAAIAKIGVTEVRAVATSASRDAGNAAELVERLARHGVSCEVISGEREASLTFAGATFGMEGEGLLVVDIGGGSTELVYGDVSRAPSDPDAEGGATASVRIRQARSIDVGARRLTELFLHTDPPTGREIDEAAGWVTDEVRSYFSALGERPREIISVAGTPTTLTAIELGMDVYDSERVHGFRLSGASVLDSFEHLAALAEAERRHVIGLEPERASVIVAGALILQVVLALAGLSSTLVSEHDILYGMVLDADEWAGGTV